MKRNYSITPMDDQTYRIDEGPGTVYSYLLMGQDKAILIDTGMGTIDFKAITDELTTLPVEVLNTHGHLDHISRNYQYERAYIHPDDESVYLDHSSYQTRYELFAGVLAESRIPRFVLKLPLIRQKIARQCTMPAVDNRKPVIDGDVLDLGGRHLQIIHTPGHTPGSICILDIERKWLYSGDTVCDQGVLLILDHSESVETFQKSVEKLLNQSSRFDKIWPAHHAVPIDKSTLSAYIECAILIINGSASGTPTSTPVGDGLELQHGNIGIAYRPDHLREAK